MARHVIMNLISKTLSRVHLFRRKLYHAGFFRSAEFSAPVISVGNLSMGGTGKTPLTRSIAKFFNEKGMSVWILTRGYKGKREHSGGFILAGQSVDVDEYGDEPSLLARDLKYGVVVVGKNRFEMANSLLQEERPDIIILDDGFQHLKIRRDIDLVLMNEKDLEAKVFPAGMLREGRKSLQAADAFILTKSSTREKFNSLNVYNRPIFELEFHPDCICNLDHKNVGEVSSIRNQKFILMSAIGNPDNFELTVRKLGGKIVGRYDYKDHQQFDHNDLVEILEKSFKSDAKVLVTEKDAEKIKKSLQKIKNFAELCKDEPFNKLTMDTIWYLKIYADFKGGDFWNYLESKMKAMIFTDQ